MRLAHTVFRIVFGVGSSRLRNDARRVYDFSGGGSRTRRFAFAHLVLFKGEL